MLVNDNSGSNASIFNYFTGWWYNGDHVANVICRAGGFANGSYHWGRYMQRGVHKASQVWFGEYGSFQCRYGNESSWEECRHGHWINPWRPCTHKYDFAVRCYFHTNSSTTVAPAPTTYPEPTTPVFDNSTVYNDSK